MELSLPQSTSSTIKALAFDVFGTVVDHRSTIAREGELLNRAKGLSVDENKDVSRFTFLR
jgi:hypothetical protein